MTIRERFWSKVDKEGPVPASPYRPLASRCWVWKAATRTGYGVFYVGTSPRGRQQFSQAHVWAYQSLVGSIPVGLQLDHLCRVRACVNPDHLEPVTPRTNSVRGDGPSARNARVTHCPQGHPYAGDNLARARSKGSMQRVCQACNREHVARYRREKAAR